LGATRPNPPVPLSSSESFPEVKKIRVRGSDTGPDGVMMRLSSKHALLLRRGHSEKNPFGSTYYDICITCVNSGGGGPTMVVDRIIIS